MDMLIHEHIIEAHLLFFSLHVAVDSYSTVDDGSAQKQKEIGINYC